MTPRTLEELRALAAGYPPIRVAIAGADSRTAMEAGHAAEAAGLASIIPVHASTEAAICEKAAQLAADDACDVVMKGSVHSDALLRAILDKRFNLRTGRLLSDVLIYEDTLSGSVRLVGVTDGGVNVQPNSGALYHIIENALEVFHAIGFEKPRVAILSATEVVSDALSSTVAARQAAQARYSLPCELAGPLALDNALVPAAAKGKGIEGPVAGNADILVTPSIEAGNILGKAVKYFGGSACAHVVVGAKLPVLIPSRVESAEDKLYSIMLGSIVRAFARR